MSQIDKMGLEFKEFAELKKFAEAQQKTILQLSKQVKEKDEEVKHLKKLVESTTPIIQTEDKKILNTEDNDQEFICRMELKKLRDISLERELTLEEAKKVDIYTKLLLSLTKKSEDNPKEKEVKEIDTAALLAALNAPEKK